MTLTGNLFDYTPDTGSISETGSIGETVIKT